MSADGGQTTNDHLLAWRRPIELAAPRLVVRAIGILAVAALALGVFILGRNNLGNHYFWSDESSAFFTSLGWPGPGQAPGDLAAIWSTLITFLDPGLFQLMTRAWIDTFGTSIETLRLLPFTFFVAYVLGLVLWFRLVRAPWFLAAAGASVLMLENITPFYSVEVRPYSASLAAAVLLPLATLWFISRPSWWRLLGFTLAFMFLASMQFNSATVDIACGILLLGALIINRRERSRVRITLATLLSFAWLPGIYLATRGNPFEDKAATLTYIQDTLLRFQTHEQIVNTLHANFLSWTALPRTAFLLLVPILWATRRLAPLTDRVRLTHALIGWIWLYVAAALAAALGLSILGYLPWVVGTRWSITDIGYIGLSLVGLIGLALLTDWPKKRVVAWAMVVVAALASAAGLYRLTTYHRPHDVNYMSALAPAILSGKTGGTLIDYWIYPDARYWMEYSGENDALRPKWLTHGINSTEGFTPASTAEIEAFLGSPADRLLLRSQRVLDGAHITLPANVQMVTVPGPLPTGEEAADVPILLVKSLPN